MQGVKGGVSIITNNKNGIQDLEENIVSEVSSTVLDKGLKRVPLSLQITATTNSMIDNVADNFSKVIVNPETNKISKVTPSSYKLTVTDRNQK